MRCDGCTHWDRDTSRAPAGHGACGAIVGMDHYEFDLVKYRADLPRAVAVSSECGGADVYTRCDFGCVLFEPRVSRKDR